MLVFGLDSSAELSHLALLRQEGRQCSFWEESGRQAASHNEELGILAARLFEIAGAKGESADLLVVGAGPGSFTGLRLGYAFIKGLSFAWRAAVGTLSTFDAYAWEFGSSARLVAALADARRDEVFCSIYLSAESGSEGPRCLEGPLILSAAAAAEKMRALAEQYNILNSEVVFAGCACKAAEKWPFKLSQPQHVARSLIEGYLKTAEARDSEHVSVESHLPVFDLQQLSALEPQYVRAVAARTIAERQALKTAS